MNKTAILAVLILLAWGAGLRAQAPAPKPPIKPPGQRPPGKPPAGQMPPHAAPKTPAKTLEALPTYEGQNVSAIEIAGWPGLKERQLLAQLPQQARAPFARAKVEQSVAVLRRELEQVPAPAGGPPPRHLHDIQLQVIPEMNGVRILFILEPADYFGTFAFPGALKFSYTRLLEAANYQPRTPYAAGDVNAARTGLLSYFRQQGYFQAVVKPELKEDRNHGLVEVVFHTQLGPLAKYGQLIFPGLSPSRAAHLRGVLSSVWARLHRASVRSGSSYSFSGLQSAVSYLQRALNGEGYMAAQVALAGASYHRGTNRADITFEVKAGPIIHLQVTGIHLWPWTRHGLIPIYSESRVDPEVIQEGQSNLTDYLSSHGYFQAKVTTTVTTAGGGKRVTSQKVKTTAAVAPRPAPPPAKQAAPAQSETIEYVVTKGPRHDVEKIQFSGNDYFSRADLLPQVAVQPEGLLSHGTFSERLLEQSVTNIENMYAAAGYSSARVTPAIKRPGGNVAVTFKIEEGPQDFVQSLQIEGNTLTAAELAPKGLNVGPGTPFAQKLIAQDKAQILAQYLTRGYLNASFRARAEKISGHPHEIRVVYQITPGPQVRIATVITEGRQQTKQRLINRLTSKLAPENFLTENDILAAESQLYQPGIFDWAEVGPRRPITTQHQEDLVIKVHESKRNLLTYGFGFDMTNRGGSIPSGTVALPGLPVVGLPSNFKTNQATFYGPSVNLEYTRLNLFGKAETVSIGAYAGRLDQRGSLTYTDPNLFWTDFSGNLLISAEHNSENPIFTSREAQAGYQLEHALNPDKTTNVFLRYSFSQTGLTRLLIPALVPQRDRSISLSTLSFTFLRDTRDNPLDAHKGMLESYEVDYNPSALGSSVNFTKMVTQTAYYKRLFGTPIVWANSLRFGFEHPFGNSFVPLSQKFFSGGGSTLRGFPLDGAGPQESIPACGDPNNPATCALIRVPLGGNALLILNSELRIPTPQIYSGLGIALFYDGGNVFSHLGFHNLGASYTNNIGIGLRYETPVGPIRIDLGHNLNAIPGITATQYFITLGQAF